MCYIVNDSFEGSTHHSRLGWNQAPSPTPNPIIGPNDLVSLENLPWQSVIAHNQVKIIIL